MDDDKSMRKLFMMHVARTLATHMQYFKLAFDDLVAWHVKHSHYKEMSTKSVVVCDNCIKLCILLIYLGTTWHSSKE